MSDLAQGCGATLINSPSKSRLHAVLVARNEAARHLDAVLEHLPTASIHLYDDGSEDDTVAVARRHGVVVTRRPETVPSFLDHEGQFRQAAWHAFEAQLLPEIGDWVLVIDCDEFLTGPNNVRGRLTEAIRFAEARGATSIELPIPEVWDFRRGVAWVRKDGYWGTLSAPRLIRYRPGGEFGTEAMGCSATPSYGKGGVVSRVNVGLSLAHVGYLWPEDRVAKHLRYSSMVNSGHNEQHVRSILTTPRLEVWPDSGLTGGGGGWWVRAA